jgi:tetratricopeptide (TPR) repeat protein
VFAAIAFALGTAPRANGAEPTPAEAPPRNPEDLEEAKARFKAGTTFFEKGDFKSAIAEFQGGFILTRNPAFLINIGICQHRMGDAVLALTTFQDFLQRAPDSPRALEVQGLVAELERELGVRPTPTPATETAVRDSPTPEPATLPVAAAPGADDDGLELLSTRPGRRLPAVSDPALIERRTGDGASDAGGSGRVWLWVGLGVVVAAVILGAVALSAGGEPAPGTLGTIDLR